MIRHASRLGARWPTAVALAMAVTAATACGSDSEDGEAANGDTGGTSSNGSGGGSGADGADAGAQAGSNGGTQSGGGTQGGTGGAANGSSGGPQTGTCLPALARCGDSSDPCCEGSVCFEEDGEARCRETCQERTDCGSLCCENEPSLGMKICVAADRCPAIMCSDEGGACGGPGESCCAGLTCVGASNPEYAGCRPPCMGDDDCDSGCCVKFANSDNGFCADAALCSCSGVDQPCGGLRRCCDGLGCTTFDNTGAFACKPLCQGDGDCDTNCCVEIAMASESVCLPDVWCPDN